MNVTIELAPKTLDAIRKLAAERGQSLEVYLSELATVHAGAQLEAEAFFAERGRGADRERLRSFLSREGGQPPRPGDEIDP